MEKDDEIGVALIKEACPACTKEMDGPIIMNRMIGNKAANKRVNDMNGKVMQMADHFCNECEGYAKEGIIMITVDPEKTEDMNNPWRTGGFFVLSEDAIKRIFENYPKLDEILKKRMTYIEHAAAQHLGLFDAKADS
jgi:hypothetical protein